MADWKPIETGPKDGRRVKLLIPYNPSLYSESECTDEGYWQPGAKASIGMGVPQWGVEDGGCWRFDGDDGAYDIQPTHWKPI